MGAVMRVRGGGRIDFNNEDLDCNLFVKTDRMQEFPVRVTGKLHDPKTSVSAGTAILYAVTCLTHGIFELLGGVMDGPGNLLRLSRAPAFFIPVPPACPCRKRPCTFPAPVDRTACKG